MKDTNPGGVSPRKSMAMGKTPSGAAAVGKSVSPRQIMSAAPGGELSDSERGIGSAGIKRPGMEHPAQAAPDHGPSGRDGWSREGKY